MAIQDFLDSCPSGVELVNNVQINWSVPGIGCGEFYFYTKDDIVHCSNECMGREFIKRILNQMVDDCVLHDEKPASPCNS